MTSFARSLGRTLIEDTAKRGRPMNEKESHLLIMLGMMDNRMMGAGDPAHLNAIHEDAMRQSFTYRILTDRIAVTTAASVDVIARLFLAQLAEGSPGKAVLMAAVVAELSEDGTRKVTLDTVVKAFPWNVPSDDVMETAWQLQKSKTYEGTYFDNALDGKWAWDTSIQAPV